MQGTLIECPECAKQNKRNVLGRLTSGNKVEVQRFHRLDGITSISAGTLVIGCSCGYQGTIARGTITHQYDSNRTGSALA